jgi:hypothetical protein
MPMHILRHRKERGDDAIHSFLGASSVMDVSAFAKASADK